jgi:predicted Zn-dependent peptidase
MFEVSTIKNGLRILTNSAPSTKSVAIAIFVGAGGRYENMNINGGVSHYLEHLLFKGSKKRPNAKKISETIDRVGGYINAYTSEDQTCYYVKLPKQHLHLGFDVLADMIINPLLKHDELERERGVIIEEMNVYRDDPARYIGDFVGELLWPHSSLKTNVIGKEPIIKKMARKQVTSYYKKMYQPNNMVVAISGDIKHDEMLRMVQARFSRLKNTSKIRRDRAKGAMAKNKSVLLSKKTHQTHFIICSRAPKMSSQENVIFSTLCTILGKGMSSRLFLTVRERKGLAYTVIADNHGFVDTGKMEIYAGVKTEKTALAIKAIMVEIKKIKDKPVSARELEKAKEQIKGGLIMNQEDNQSVALSLGAQLIIANKAISMEGLVKKVDQVRPSDIQRIANKYFRPNSFRLAIIGPYDEKQQQDLDKLINLEG